MSVVLLLAVLFTIGLGLVAFSNRGDMTKLGFILQFVSALIYTITLIM